jgi:hypothetical protein
MNTVGRTGLRRLAALGFLLAAATAMAEPKADFSGTWMLVKDRSEGLPPGMTQSMTVKQTGDSINIETTVSGEKGEQKIADHYVLDGKETPFTPPIIGSGGAAKNAKRTSKWSTDGAGFDATEEAVIYADEGPVAVKTARHWQLSADGKTLVIEMDFDGPQGEMKSRRVFTRG